MKPQTLVETSTKELYKQQGTAWNDPVLKLVEARKIEQGTTPRNMKGPKLRVSRATRSYVRGYVNFTPVKDGDFVRLWIDKHPTGGNPFRVAPLYILVSGATRWSFRIQICVVTESYVLQRLHKKANPTKSPNTILISKKDMTLLTKKWVNTRAIADSVSGLAHMIAWFDKALQRTVAERKHPPDTRTKLVKVKKMRMRAGHPSTPAPEKEICLRMVARTLEGLVAPEFLPSLSVEKAMELQSQGHTYALSSSQPAAATASQRVKTPPPSQPRTTTATTGAPKKRKSDEVLPIAQAIMAVLGSRAKMRQSPVRISIKHPMWNRGVLFAVFAGARFVQVMCPVFSSLGVSKRDSTGVPYIRFHKPIGSRMVSDVDKWAKDVVAHLAQNPNP